MRAADGADPVASLDHTARHARTPCGDGTMAWRSWGEGTPLVLLHGGAGSWQHWVRNIPVLAGSHQVWAPDTPGLGDSDLPPDPGSSEGIGAIVGDGIDRLLGPHARYHLCGFSFGGLLAAAVAARHGARLISLTLVGSGGLGGPRPEMRLEKVRTKTGADRVAAHRTNLARMMFADPANIDELALSIQAWNSDHARLNSTGFHAAAPVPALLSRVGVPINGIWGARDNSSGPYLPQREALLRRLRPDIDFRIVPGAGHWVAYEAATAFSALLRQMLGNSEGQGSALDPLKAEP